MEIRRINNGKIFYFGNEVIPKYSFNAKELDEETGMYYFEARYYRAPTFISRDPLMNEKPWLTPYHYCSNNPVGKVDPSGMSDDWYENESGTAVFWREGNASSVEVNGEIYHNIGKTYSKQNEDGSYTNFYQNVGFTSEQKFDAEDYILENGLAGKYIGEKSPLAESAKTELAQASVRYGQSSFGRGAIEGIADICNATGTMLTGLGTTTSFTPIGGALVTIGGAFSTAGTIIDGLLNIADGNYKQAAVNATSFAVGRGTNKLWKSLNLTPNQANFLKGKSDLQNSTATNIINNGIEKKQNK